MKNLTIALALVLVAQAPRTVTCEFHQVEATHVQQTVTMDVYCHPDSGYVVRQHCFGLVIE